MTKKSGNKKKLDSEYSRSGFCSIFVICKPLAGWSYACVREHRTAKDWAAIWELVDFHSSEEIFDVRVLFLE